MTAETTESPQPVVFAKVLTNCIANSSRVREITQRHAQQYNQAADRILHGSDTGWGRNPARLRKNLLLCIEDRLYGSRSDTFSDPEVFNETANLQMGVVRTELRHLLYGTPQATPEEHLRIEIDDPVPPPHTSRTAFALDVVVPAVKIAPQVAQGPDRRFSFVSQASTAVWGDALTSTRLSEIAVESEGIDKENLPAWAYAGDFGGVARRGSFPRKHSGLFFVDVDGFETILEAERCVTQFRKDSRCVVAYLSQSRKGVHCFVQSDRLPTNAEEHKAIWEAVVLPFAAEYGYFPKDTITKGVRLDTAVADVNRLVFLSTDLAGKPFNFNAKPICVGELTKTPKTAKKRHPRGPRANLGGLDYINMHVSWEQVSELCGQIVTNYGAIRCPHPDHRHKDGKGAELSIFEGDDGCMLFRCHGNKAHSGYGWNYIQFRDVMQGITPCGKAN